MVPTTLAVGLMLRRRGFENNARRSRHPIENTFFVVAYNTPKVAPRLNRRNRLAEHLFLPTRLSSNLPASAPIDG